MKTFFLKPGFEFVFSLCFIVILALPPVLMAQTNKNVDISITNGDTTVNGKNIKELSYADRQEALKDINRISAQPAMSSSDNTNSTQTFSFRRKDSVGGRITQMDIRRKKMSRDSMGVKAFSNPSAMRRMDYPRNDGARMMMAMRNERRNSQNFDYTTTDNEGISTHLRFHVSEISNEDLKKMPHVEGGKFEISDLNLVPEFSTGKTVLMFNLPAKTIADIKFTDSQGKMLFSEKVNGGKFIKTFPLGLNGIYYMQVKQGNNIAIKKITREE